MIKGRAIVRYLQYCSANHIFYYTAQTILTCKEYSEPEQSLTFIHY